MNKETTIDDRANFEVTVSVKDVKTIIKEQPTVYNIDKIVEELELHSFELGTDTLPVHYVRLNDAIEIIKQGGVSAVSDASDNVCEWYKVNGNACKCYTHAEIYDSRVLDWCICPYCRKKIKIVGD